MLKTLPIIASAVTLFAGCFRIEDQVPSAQPEKSSSARQIEVISLPEPNSAELIEKLFLRAKVQGHRYRAWTTDQLLELVSDDGRIVFLADKTCNCTFEHALTDEDIGVIAQAYPNLELLFLPHTLITDKSIDKLAGLVRLRVLILGSTDLTENGLRKLVDSLPKCSVRAFDSSMTYCPEYLPDHVQSPVLHSTHEFPIEIRLSCSDSTDVHLRQASLFSEVSSVAVYPMKNGITFPNVTDRGVESVLKMPELNYLTVIEAKNVTKRVIPLILEHPSICEASFQDTAATVDEARQIMLRNPDSGFELSGESTCFTLTRTE